MTADEVQQRRERRLIERAQTNDRRSVQQLLERYRPMAIAYSSRWSIPGYDASDTLQLALIGVANAIRRFDPARGSRTLSTLAHLCIQRELEHKLRETLGSQALSVQRRSARKAVRQALSLDEPIRPDCAGVVSDQCCRSDLLPSKAGYGEPAESIAVSNVIYDELMASLPAAERMVLRLDAAGYTQAEISAKLGVSQVKAGRLLARGRRRAAAWI